MSVLNEVVCVNLDIRIWSGKKRLSAADLEVSEAALPPQDLATLGSKKLCDPMALLPFHRIEQHAQEACRRIGVRFLSGYGIPRSKSSALADELAGLNQEFEQARLEFLSIYEEALRMWVAAHPGWESLLKEVVPREVVARKFSFAWQMFTVSEPVFAEERGEEVAGHATALAGGLAKAVDDLPEQLFAEISSDAREAWKQSFEGKTALTRKALRPLKSILKKLELLEFLAPAAIQPLSARIRSRLAAVPAHGPIPEMALAGIAGIIFTLAEPDRLKQYVGLLERGLALDEASLLQGSFSADNATEPMDSDSVQPSLFPEAIPEFMGEPDGHPFLPAIPEISVEEPVSWFF